MAEAELSDRQRELIDAVDVGLVALDGVDTDDEDTRDNVDELRQALGFSRVCVEATEPVLLTDAAYGALLAVVQRLPAETTSIADAPHAYIDSLVESTLRLPASRAMDLEQAARDAAANYGRATKARLNNFEDDIDATKARLDGFGEIIEAHQATLDTQLSENATLFASELAALHEKEEEAFRTRLAEIERMAKEAGALTGAIALSHTAAEYEEEAKQQKKAADWLRRLTIAFAVGSVAMAIWAVVHHADDTNTLVAKLAVSGVLGGLAGYTAQQSGKHRKREVRAKDLQLQLTAFSPFIEPLLPELQQAERVRMTRKTFGASLPDADDDAEYGPSFLSFIREAMKRDEPE